MPPRKRETKQVTDNVRTHSRPSELKITDMRIAVVSDPPWSWPIIRLDTNQGISGLGEVRDFASKSYALMLKSRLLGENPCDVDRLFRKINGEFRTTFVIITHDRRIAERTDRIVEISDGRIRMDVKR